MNTAEEMKLVPPSGGRVEIVRVSVQTDRDWQKAINAAGLNTPDDHNVRVGGKYLAGQGTLETEIILMNFGQKGCCWDRGMDWAKENGLKRTSPRHVFAVTEHRPQLHRELGMNPMYVVATVATASQCVSHSMYGDYGNDYVACGIWRSGWFGTRCDFFLYWWFLEKYGDSKNWLAFLRE